MEIGQDLIEMARLLALRVRRLVDNGLGGAYASKSLGGGLEFAELRKFNDNDDSRLIHWPTTLTHGKPYAKRFVEEREQDLLICLDTSSSMRSNQLVWSQALELSCLLAGCALRNGDGVGLVLHSSQPESYLPVVKGQRQLLKLVRLLLQPQVKTSGTNLTGLLETARNLLKKRSRIMVISDWLDNSDYQTAFQALSHAHDVLACQIRIPAAESLPPAGWLEVQDSESGQSLLVNWADARVQAVIQQKRVCQTDALRSLAYVSGADFLLLDGNQTPFEAISTWLHEH